MGRRGIVKVEDDTRFEEGGGENYKEEITYGEERG